jgi:hypothetical protein
MSVIDYLVLDRSPARVNGSAPTVIRFLPGKNQTPQAPETAQKIPLDVTNKLRYYFIT